MPKQEKYTITKKQIAKLLFEQYRANLASDALLHHTKGKSVTLGDIALHGSQNMEIVLEILGIDFSFSSIESQYSIMSMFYEELINKNIYSTEKALKIIEKFLDDISKIN